jgi:3D (Asp-Asp-Asp) domain-containing protein
MKKIIASCLMLVCIISLKAEVKAVGLAGISEQISEYAKEVIKESEKAKIEETKESSNIILIESTAYYNYNNTTCSDGTIPTYGTIAGKIEWLGKKAKLYRVAEDGSIGDLIGTFIFHDTGYGQSTGYGNSKILKGKTVGTIENGTCIDIFMSTKEQCVNYGRKNVYLEILEE